MPLESTLAALADPEKKLTSEHLITLSDLDTEEAAIFGEAWEELPLAMQKRLLTQLTELAEENIELNYDTIFELALSHEDEAVRIAAMHGLHESEKAHLGRRYVAILRADPDTAVRREAAVALGRYAMAAALDHLDEPLAEEIKRALFDSAEDLEEDDLVRARAIEAAGALGGEETENLIESIYREEASFWLRVGAVDAMGRSAEEVWLPVVSQEMENSAPEMRHAAAHAAGEIGSEAAIDQLRRLAVADRNRDVQLAAIGALGEIAGDKARVALKAVLFEGDEELTGPVQEALQAIQFDDNPLGIPG